MPSPFPEIHTRLVEESVGRKCNYTLLNMPGHRLVFLVLEAAFQITDLMEGT